MRPVLEVKGNEEGAHFLPQIPLGMMLGLPGLLKEGASVGLELVDGKGQHHQQGEIAGQLLVPMAEVVLEMVALVFERVKRFIFDFPAGTSSSHEGKDVVGRQGEIGTPGEMKGFPRRALFPILPEVDVELGMLLVQGKVIDPAKARGHALGIEEGVFLELLRGGPLLDPG